MSTNKRGEKMKKKLVKIAMLAGLLVSVLAMAGCGKKAAPERKIDKNAIYKEVDLGIKFPEGMEVNNVVVEKTSDRLFAYGYSIDDIDYSQLVASCKFDGSDMRSFKLPEKNSYLDTILPLSDEQVLILYSCYDEIESEDAYDYNTYYYAAVCDLDGKVINKIDLSEDIDWVGNVKLVKDKIVMFCDDKAFAYDKDLKLVTKKEYQDTSIGRIYTLRDGSLLVTYWGPEKMAFKKIDPDTLELSEDIELKTSIEMYDVLEGQDYDLLLRDSSSVYGFNITDETPTLLLNFVDSDIEASYFNTFASLDSKTFIGGYYNYEAMDEESGFKISKYEKVNPEDVVEKEILTLGCLYLDGNVKSQVIKFNKTNEKYRIRVIDYSLYNTEEDYDAGSKKFNSDIAAGKGPDIVVASDSSSVHNYISKGLYLDLNPFIEKDPEINKADFFPNLLEASSSDGKLYEIIPYFYVETLVGKKSILGDKTGWTMQEMRDFENTLPEGSKLFMGTTREDFINSMLSVNSETYVDMNSGKCSFDTGDFKGLLEYAKALPVGDDAYYDSLEEEGFWENYETMWRSGKAVLMNYSLSGIRGYNELCKGYMGEDVTFIGYPSEDRQGSSIYYYFSLGISSKCASPESAWEFVRTYMLPSYQSTIEYGLPASMVAFDELGKKAQERNSFMDGDDLIYEDDEFYINGEFVKIDPITPAEVDKLKNFLLSVKKIQGSLSDVEVIIDEETQGYFLGDKSVDDVVKNIQGRVQLFINEKR